MLQRLNIEFSCSSPDVDESALAGEPATALAERLALVKAQTVASQFPNTVVVGADQVAELNGTILGKPGNHQQAVKQLTAQAGKRVLFHSGLAIVRIQADGEMQQHSLINTTEVTFRPLSQKQIEQYLLTEQPYDCAGSFKAEGLGISLFTSINSNDPTSLIGLPLIDLCSALPQFSINII